MAVIDQKKVQVIGLQPRKVQIVASIHSMVIVCDCGSATPILIPNVDRAGFCAACKTKYVISQIKFENNAGQVGMETAVAKWAGPMSASNELTVGLDAAPSDTQAM